VVDKVFSRFSSGHRMPYKMIYHLDTSVMLVDSQLVVKRSLERVGSGLLVSPEMNLVLWRYISLTWLGRCVRHVQY
jgi:hypothetical protein